MIFGGRFLFHGAGRKMQLEESECTVESQNYFTKGRFDILTHLFWNLKKKYVTLPKEGPIFEPICFKFKTYLCEIWRFFYFPRKIFVSNLENYLFQIWRKKVFVSNLEVIDLAQGADGAHNESTKSLPKFPSVKTDRETHNR